MKKMIGSMDADENGTLSFEECLKMIPDEMISGADEVPEDEWECGIGILNGLKKAFEEKDFEAIGRTMDSM